eukprot:scaffold8006_cov113-Isochrysis_galbana.AAC.10
MQPSHGGIDVVARGGEAQRVVRRHQQVNLADVHPLGHQIHRECCGRHPLEPHRQHGTRLAKDHVQQWRHDADVRHFQKPRASHALCPATKEWTQHGACRRIEQLRHGRARLDPFGDPKCCVQCGGED